MQKKPLLRDRPLLLVHQRARHPRAPACEPVQRQHGRNHRLPRRPDEREPAAAAVQLNLELPASATPPPSSGRRDSRPIEVELVISGGWPEREMTEVVLLHQPDLSGGCSLIVVRRDASSKKEENLVDDMEKQRNKHSDDRKKNKVEEAEKVEKSNINGSYQSGLEKEPFHKKPPFQDKTNVIMSLGNPNTECFESVNNSSQVQNTKAQEGEEQEQEKESVNEVANNPKACESNIILRASQRFLEYKQDDGDPHHELLVEGPALNISGSFQFHSSKLRRRSHFSSLPQFSPFSLTLILHDLHRRSAVLHQRRLSSAAPITYAALSTIPDYQHRHRNRSPFCHHIEERSDSVDQFGSITDSKIANVPVRKFSDQTEWWEFLHKVQRTPEDEIIWPVLGSEWIIVVVNSIVDRMPNSL
ncbi:hypothetical protein RHSIM_Rhsim09G0039600 [Rhododendron simsii]|uniref:Uncharacterized protein n=1 Tax=Rhododendron simsii TaxID=118357 RepID=A0A834GDY4_RHOSS|nr:hypothetical protein RHSIM_Rhsim09G0039600 [Rhododendron simsii]